MALSPMMKQYMNIKEQNPDSLLLFRLGDFYELFFEDAKTASQALELTLTGRDCGLAERAPMCGVPFHSADAYIERLIKQGFKVAICEQLTQPTKGAGIVERGVVRVITPGTFTKEGVPDSCYVLCIHKGDAGFGIAFSDVSTGEFKLTQCANLGETLTEAERLRPKEIIVSEGQKALFEELKECFPGAMVSATLALHYTKDYATDVLLEKFSVANLDVFEVGDMEAGIVAAGALMEYLKGTSKSLLIHITRLQPMRKSGHMIIDRYTERNLELLQTMREGKKKGSLLGVMDKTRTAMGSRLIKRWMTNPLTDKKRIDSRLAGVDELKNGYALRCELVQALTNISDVERLVSKLAVPAFSFGDIAAFVRSMAQFPVIKSALAESKSALLRNISNEITPLEDLHDYLCTALAGEKHAIEQGEYIAPGFNVELDKFREAKTQGKSWIANLEAREKEATGIKNLKISYNRVFGYYIEVTKSFLDKVPYEYIRKQTLAGAERYFTEELKDLEHTVLSAEDEYKRLEGEIFEVLKRKLEHHIEELQRTAAAIGVLDVLVSFAQVAYDNAYCKPKMCEDGVIEIKGGRHPVVERVAKQDFVPNDAYMNAETDRLLMITGPNMAGKSTYMRQTGIIVLLAHMGSFVPAASAQISITDRIFTRVGASDDLASGQSTFMVEMNELAHILRNATGNSLVILDEIGRGTSTLDGLAIAWATSEYVLKQNCKTLFATHFHELTQLEHLLTGVKNYSVGVKEVGNSVVFLHHIRPGGADKSFGIEVAKLAGLPGELTERAKLLVAGLEEHGELTLHKVDTTKAPDIKPADYSAVINRIKYTDTNAITPFEAMCMIMELKEEIERG